MRPISTIARDIKRAWTKPNYAAVPYLETMLALHTIDDVYYNDDARSIIRYFLANASSFRGDDARALKTELKGML